MPVSGHEDNALEVPHMAALQAELVPAVGISIEERIASAFGATLQPPHLSAVRPRPESAARTLPGTLAQG